MPLSVVRESKLLNIATQEELMTLHTDSDNFDDLYISDLNTPVI